MRLDCPISLFVERRFVLQNYVKVMEEQAETHKNDPTGGSWLAMGRMKKMGGRLGIDGKMERRATFHLARTPRQGKKREVTSFLELS